MLDQALWLYLASACALSNAFGFLLVIISMLPCCSVGHYLSWRGASLAVI